MARASCHNSLGMAALGRHACDWQDGIGAGSAASGRVDLAEAGAWVRPVSRNSCFRSKCPLATIYVGTANCGLDHLPHPWLKDFLCRGTWPSRVGGRFRQDLLNPATMNKFLLVNLFFKEGASPEGQSGSGLRNIAYGAGGNHLCREPSTNRTLVLTNQRHR